MKITIEFDTDNAAFEDNFGSEVNFVVGQARRAVDYCSDVGDRYNLRDSYGNTIGEVRFS